MFTVNNNAPSDTTEDIPLQVSDFTSEANTQTGEIIAYDGTNWKNKSASGGEAFSLGLSSFMDESSGIYISSSYWTSTNGYIPHYRSTQYGNLQIFSDSVAHVGGVDTFTSADWEASSSSSAFLKHGTVSTTGKYLCICCLASVKLGYNDLQTLRWVKNGVAFGAYYQVDRYARRPTTMIAVADCQADDTIGIKFQDGTGNKDLANSDQHKQHSLSIFKL